MNSQHVSFARERNDSFGSLDSDETYIDDIFENDYIDEDDYISHWYYGTPGQAPPIFTVDNEFKYSPHGLTANSSGDQEPVKYFTHKLSFRGWMRRFFVRNYSSRSAVAVFDLTLKILICAAYVVRVHLDDVTKYECHGHPCDTEVNVTISERDALFAEQEINWHVLLWVHRTRSIWIVENSLTFTALAKALLMLYIASKGHRLEYVMSPAFILEILCGLPMLVTLGYPILKKLFVPVYVNCWLGRMALERLYNDLRLSRQSYQSISVVLLQKMVLLVTSLACLVFTTLCTIQHIQRASYERQLSLFDSFYFVIVTFSTVGYGDISPDIWLSRLFMIVMICVAFATIPAQIEGLVSTYSEREKGGGEYNPWSHSKKHVLVCSSTLTQDTLLELLNEFYAFPRWEERTLVILCPQELDSGKKLILNDTKWAHRIIYMKGSALKDQDLTRCHAKQAFACFLLAPRPTSDKAMADRHTILRSWSVKEFAPHCKQYVFLFNAANKIHVRFAEYVVCEDEFTYALLANNCLYPGLSTLVSLLVHSATSQNSIMGQESWNKLYESQAKNEIFHIQLHKSIFFGQYIGETFPHASADAHCRFGVALLGVLDSESPVPHLQLNPGLNYRLKAADICFYMSVAREELSHISPYTLKQLPPKKSEHDIEMGAFNNVDSLLSTRLEDVACGLGRMRQNMSDCEQSDSNHSGELASKANSTCSGASASSVPLLKQASDESEGFSESHAEPEDKDETEYRSRLDPKDLLDDRRISSDDESCYNSDVGEIPNLSTGNSHKKRKRRFSLRLVEDTGRVFNIKQFKALNYARPIRDLYLLGHGSPPRTTSTCYGQTQCYIMAEPKQLCCLEWGKNCSHCTFKNASSECWEHRLIILVAEQACDGIFNFIVPLRSSSIGIHALSPIVLLLEEQPSIRFLQFVANFPVVYYMIGSIKSVDDLLLAGINKTSHLVVVNRNPPAGCGDEEFLKDAETVIAVQTITRLFPNICLLTTLSQSSNMRFMKLSTGLSSRKMRDQTPVSIRELYRSPFAAGHVFASSMLDTLLYQTFTKGYLIMFVKLLLGIDAEEGCGHLSSIRVKKSIVQRYPSYGHVYQRLCAATGEIPFAIYRTEQLHKESKDRVTNFQGNILDLPGNNDTASKRKFKPLLQRMNRRKSLATTLGNRRLSVVSKISHVDLPGIVKNRLQSLAMAADDYDETKRPRNMYSYIITNPPPGERLRIGDIIYVIQPSNMCATPSKQQYFTFRQNSQMNRFSIRSNQVTPRRSALKSLFKDRQTESIRQHQSKETGPLQIMINGQKLEEHDIL